METKTTPSIKDIKFERERVDEWTVRHWYKAGTRYLGAVYATKHYGYTVYDENGKMLTFHNDYLHTLKDVKEWIANYDANEDARLAEKKAEDERREREYREERQRELEATKAYSKFVSQPKKHKEGDRLKIRCAAYSKPSTLGEAYESARTSGQIREAKVVKVINLSDEVFDAWINDVYAIQSEEITTEGGSASDDPRIPDDLPCYKWTPEMMEIFRETSYELVHAVQSPHRKTFFINSEGYEYARYIHFAAEE